MDCAHQQKMFDIRRNLTTNYSKVQLTARHSLAAAPCILHNQIYADLRVFPLELLCTHDKFIAMPGGAALPWAWKEREQRHQVRHTDVDGMMTCVTHV